MLLRGEEENASRVGLEATELASPIDQLLRLDVVNQVVATETGGVEVGSSQELLTVRIRHAEVNASPMLDRKFR